MVHMLPSTEAATFCGQRISLAPTYPFSPSAAFLSPHPASPTISTHPRAAPGLCSPCPVTSLHLPWITQHALPALSPAPPSCTPRTSHYPIPPPLSLYSLHSPSCIPQIPLLHP